MSDISFIYAIVDSSTNLVINRVSWDGEINWSPGDGFAAVRVDDPTQGSIGDTYAENKFIKAEEE
jgi:hypothetical protein